MTRKAPKTAGQPAKSATNAHSESGSKAAEAAIAAAGTAMIADIAMRMGTTIVRKTVETTLLRGRYGKEAAKALKNKRGTGRTLASTAIAKFGSNSVPGAAIVGAGLVVKLLFDRSAARRDARKAARKAAITNQSSE